MSRVVIDRVLACVKGKPQTGLEFSRRAISVMTSRMPSVSPSERVPVAAVPAGKVGMWVFLATDAMGFAGLLLAEALLRARDASWPDPAVRFDRGLAGGLTLALLVSGATMAAAVAAAKADRWAAARRLVLVTAALGAVFALGQVMEFRALVMARHVGLATDHAAGLFFVIAGYHGLHVIVGVAVLLAVALGGQRSGRGVSIEVAALYWQFVDAAWIVIFTVLYLLPAAPRG